MIRPSRADTVRLLLYRMEELIAGDDLQAADVLWQAALRLRSLDKPGPDKVPLPARPIHPLPVALDNC